VGKGARRREAGRHQIVLVDGRRTGVFARRLATTSRRVGPARRPRRARGDAYDNALAESFVDSFKTELIADRVWRTRSQLELAIVEYIGWFNHHRLHESLGDIPPAEIGALYAPRSETNISLNMKRESQLTRSP
jgi:transposase InsO family protein